MTTEPVVLPPDATVADALAELMTTGQAPEVLRPFDPGRF